VSLLRDPSDQEGCSTQHRSAHSPILRALVARVKGLRDWLLQLTACGCLAQHAASRLMFDCMRLVG
jgi:hypothetical protein